MRRILRKRTAVAVSVVAVLVVAGAAIAYLTASGSGSGSGSVTATASAMTLSISNAPALTKLGDTETYEITASNTGSSPEHVSGITVSSIAPSAAAVTAGCPTGSFSAGPTSTTGNEVPAGTVATPGTAVVGHVDVTFNDVASAQNGCLGSGTVAVSLSSN
jgi:hypothetical protein